jgi:hypothetical protein
VLSFAKTPQIKPLDQLALDAQPVVFMLEPVELHLQSFDPVL